MSSPSGRFARWPSSPGDGLRTLLIRISPSRIGFFCSVVEAYEGVAVVRTCDRQLGLLEIWIMPGQGAVVDSILTEFATQAPVVRIRESSGHPDLRLGNNPYAPKE